MDNDFVETSDVEELAELGEHRKDFHPPATPHGRNNSRQHELRRKRIKLFHEGEQAIQSSPTSYHSSPLRDSQNLNRSYREENYKSPDKNPYKPESTSCIKPETLTPPVSSQPRTSSTASVMGSPSLSQLLPSRSPTRTPPITDSAPKLSENEEPIALCSPIFESQDPLASDAPLKAATDPSQPGTPYLGTRSQSDFDIELTPEGNTQEQPPTTPPDTPHSAYRSSHFHPSLSPDPLALGHNSGGGEDVTNIKSLAPVEQLLLFSPAKTGTPLTSPPSKDDTLSLSVGTMKSDDRVVNDPQSLADERSSPLSARSPSPLARLRRIAPLEPIALPANDGVGLAELAAEQQSLRYSFRKRNAAQLAPYTADLIQYKRALRFNPDAIIKMKQIERQLEQQQQHRHPDDHYEDEGLGNQLDALEDAEWEKSERRRRKRLEKMKEAPSVQDLSHYPAILQDFLSTDEEERGMNATSKMAQKILRAKEREKKARERAEAKRRRKEEEEERRRTREAKAKRPKPYPMSKPRHESASRGSPFSENHDPMPRGSSSRHTSPPFPSFHPPAGRNVNHITEAPRAEEEVVVRNYFNDVDFEMYDDLDVFDELRPSHAHSHSSLPPSADVDFGDGVENHSEDAPQPSEGGSSDHPDLEGLDILMRMVPKGMAKEFARQAANNRRTDRRSHSPVYDVENDGPLLPGQTRVRKAINSKDIQDIRGDSESEEGERSEPASSSSSPSIISDESNSDSDSVEILQTYRPPPPRYKTIEPETIYVDSDSEGDEDIQFFVQNTRPVRKHTKLRDQSLINYMLPRVRTTGGPPRRSRSNYASNYKYDIMTRGSRGHGRERQTLLSFDEHKLTKRRRGTEAIVPDNGVDHSRFSEGKVSRTNGGALSEGNANVTSAAHAYVPDQKHLDKKEKRKIRKARAKNNGVYNFNSEGNARITNGRRTDAAFFTVDLEDEGFYHALVPTAGSRPRYEPPPPRKRKQSTGRTASTNALFEAQPDDEPPAQDDAGQAKDVSGGHLKNFTRDLGIKHISSGRSFSQSSYIRKGWLHELINVASSGVANNTAPPPSTVLCRFELNSTMGIATLTTTLTKVLDVLFEGATDILDADSDTLSDEWKSGFRVASQLISWYLQNAQEEEKMTIRGILNKEISRIANLIGKHSLSFVEKPALSLSWFLVELSVRVSVPLPTSYADLSSSLKLSSKILMQLLLRVGIQKTADAIQSTDTLDEAGLVHYATELWICLIHLLGIPKEGIAKSKSNPFWSIFMDAFPSTVDTNDPTFSVKVSEDVWLCTFTLSALSQFSVHGMATAESRLPAFWDLVAYGLKSICLTETEEQQRLQLPFLRKRDRYVALVVTRCEHLHKIWHWRLDEGSSMFNQISEIFRSRNFANLRFEDDKLPKFFKHTDWTLLESHDSTDTIFSIFLKLIMSADRDEVNVGRKSAKLKKLLSLAVPLRTVSFPTNRPPTGRELSMFYNRLSAIALALYLDPSDRDDRINKARHYVDFATADTKTRHTILCGLERLCHLMINHNMNLGTMLDWIDDISKVADADLKVFSSEHQAPSRAKNLTDLRIQLVKHLFETVSRVVASYADASRFFEPLLFGKLKSILSSSVLRTDTLGEELARLLDAISIARTRVLPKPARPFMPEDINEESQNYFEGFDDIDFAAIDDLPGNDHAADILQKDRIFRQDFDGKLIWVIYPHLKPYVAFPPPPTISWKAYANECDKWLRRWLCFNDVHQSQENKWQNSIHLLDILTREKDNDDPWMHRVNLSIMFQLLQLDPMAYLSFGNRALQVFFRALVSDSLTLENEYVSWLLSIDCLRHPLFSDAATVLPPRDASSADYQFSADQFLELRLPLIRVIFNNIECSLSKGEIAEMEARTSYVDLCHNMFSWMRRVRTQLLQKTGDMGDKSAQYTRFCSQVLEAFQEQPLLRTQHRLEFFLGWARTLATSP